MAHRVATAPAAIAIGFALLASLRAAAQTTQSATNSQASEISSSESQPTFQLHVQHNEVVVRVVVRDGKGNVVPGLHKEDFRLLDNRKPQVITHFAAETAAAAATAAGPAPAVDDKTSLPGAPSTPVIVLPRRFMALFFDDVHLEFADLVRTRDAAGRYLDEKLQPGDRAAIFTSSGQNQLDFTDDRAKLHDTLLKLKPFPILPPDADACPQIYPLQAYKMVHENDPFSIDIAHEESYQCNCIERGITYPSCQTESNGIADSMAVRVMDRIENEARYVFQGLDRICGRLASVPGQRNLVLISPGFLTCTQLFDVEQVVDKALRGNAIISVLDARGLYTVVPLGDATQRVRTIQQRPDLMAQKALIQIQNLRDDSDVLERLADETGGAYFHNSNDYGDGFRRVGSFPEAYYTLAFAPEDLKLDGRLHTLKVTLVSNPNHLTVQARQGYFAPNKSEDAATMAKEELEQMIFSQEDSETIPVKVETQYYQAGSGEARLAVVTHVDIQGVRFRKADGRNLDNLTVVTALFDQAGNYVTGEQKKIEFRLLDATLARLSRTGLSMKASLPVKRGAYLVREVVQESEGNQLSALSNQVEVP
ncbi:MAG TPA: VWA domain-containing protein [Terriglobia bacterium]|nr:VWA domain-containing protein [Terriglobia bacterium]